MIRHALPSLLLLALAAPVAAQSMRTDDVAPALAGFGASVAVAGDHVLVAEPNDVRSPGAVYAYGRQDGTWTEVGRLSADDATRGDLFGASLAASDDRVFVGSPFQGDGVGVAYVFERDGDGWRQVARLSVDEPAMGDSLGSAVAIDQDLALVAATGADSGRGAVYVFRRAEGPGEWRQVARIAAPEGFVPDDRFGEALAVSGSNAIVAAARADSGRGAVLVYRGEDEGWTQTARFAPDSLTPNARFGSE